MTLPRFTELVNTLGVLVKQPVHIRGQLRVLGTDARHRGLAGFVESGEALHRQLFDAFGAIVRVHGLWLMIVRGRPVLQPMSNWGYPGSE